MALNAKRNSIVQAITARSLKGLLRLIQKKEAKDGFVYDWEFMKDGVIWIGFYRRQIFAVVEDLEPEENE